MPTDANPYAPPPPLVERGAQAPTARVQRMLGPASIGLLVVSGLMCPYVLAVVGIPISFVAARAEAALDPDRPMPTPAELLLWQLIAATLVGVHQVLIFKGTWEMRRLRSYRWARAAVWLALIPQPIWPFEAPFAIWALLLLRKPEVRAAFEK